MAEGMKIMGYEGKGFSGYDWRNEPCDYHNYLVRPSVSKAEPFFIVRSRTTGEMHFLRGSELDRILKQHVTYDGRFLTTPRGTGDGNEYYSLGSTMRNGTQIFVYVGFDEKACGLKVDEVWYWAPRVDEKVKLNLQLLPYAGGMPVNSRIVVAALVVVAFASVFFLWTRQRSPHANSAPISTPITSPSTVDTYDHAESLKLAMQHMGYEPDTLIGTPWLGKGCHELSYLLEGGPHLFFFTRDMESGKITATLTLDQVNEELQRHISFEGSFGNSTFDFDKVGEAYYIGQVPDEERTDVYIHINTQACGVQVDRVVYRGFQRTEVVDLKIQLVPGR